MRLFFFVKQHYLLLERVFSFRAWKHFFMSSYTDHQNQQSAVDNILLSKITAGLFSKHASIWFKEPFQKVRKL